VCREGFLSFHGFTLSFLSSPSIYFFFNRARGDPVPHKYRVREAGWHESIDADVQVMLGGKTYEQLRDLERGITDQLDSAEAGDPEYWAAVLRRLGLYKSRALLREVHAEALRTHLAAQMATVDVAAAMGWAGEDAVPRRREDDGGMREEEAAPVREGMAPMENAAPAAAVSAARDDYEIELPEEDDHEEAGGKGAAPAKRLVAGEEGEEHVEDAEDEDAELAALAAVDIRKPSAAASAQRVERAERGEPMLWVEMLENEREAALLASAEMRAAADPAEPASPRPLPAVYVAGQDVVGEAQDMELLRMLRQQVRMREAERYRLAATTAASAGGPSAASGSSAAADRMYAQMIANPKSAGYLMGATNPLLRYAADQAEGPAAADADDATLLNFRSAAARAMGDATEAGDIHFGGEVPLGADAQVYWWHEKYKPRKPKYFNRVHTGYEWNKYNQTHYDGDNPPPKVVQGYKFNVFYPDLIDKTKAPTYKVERDPGSEDGSTCILRFTAGPPYEDIAFRIVNKEWEYNHKRGFKCVFDRNILHLYFNFSRQRYRR
jgi:hypothetical protein